MSDSTLRIYSSRTIRFIFMVMLAQNMDCYQKKTSCKQGMGYWVTKLYERKLYTLLGMIAYLHGFSVQLSVLTNIKGGNQRENALQIAEPSSRISKGNKDRIGKMQYQTHYIL